VLQQKSDESTNLAAAAWELNFPLKHLRVRLNERGSKEMQLPANKKLTEEDELAVCQCLDRVDRIGISVHLHMITTCVNAILLQGAGLFITLTCRGRTLGSAVPRSEYHICKQHTIDRDRKNTHDPQSILDCFSLYKNVGYKYGIQARDQYNFDETGFQIGIGRNLLIITQDPTRQAYLASFKTRELVSEIVTKQGRFHMTSSY